MKLDKRMIAILIVIIAILSAVLAYEIATPKHVDSNVNNTTNKTKELNATLENTTQTSSESGQYGYCAVCGRALTYSEAHNEYTQGKVCSDCANNPYYQSGPGAEYANGKLAEAYPDEYGWMYEDDYEDSSYESYGNSYDDSYSSDDEN